MIDSKSDVLTFKPQQYLHLKLSQTEYNYLITDSAHSIDVEKWLGVFNENGPLGYEFVLSSGSENAFDYWSNHRDNSLSIKNTFGFSLSLVKESF
jgi:hypothetical protein